MGFEVVVRPAVFPNIRPAPARVLPPLDDPDQGFAVIRGNGAKQIDLSTSWSASTSMNQRVETKRRVDEARVYQMEDNGTVNKDNFVDIQVANKIWMERGSEVTTDVYTPVREKDNIEVRERNKMIRPEDEET